MNARWLHRNRNLFPLLVAVTALVVLNGASWWAYRIAHSELQANFRRNIDAFSRFAAHQVIVAYQEELEKSVLRMESSLGSDGEFDSIETFVPEFESWLESVPPDFLIGVSPRDSDNPLYHDLYLLGRRGNLIQTWSGEVPMDASMVTSGGLWDIHPLLAGDRQEIIQSLTQSVSVVTQEEVASGGYFLTCYSPLTYNSNARGLIGVRANILFSDRLDQIRRGLLLAAAVGSILIAFLTGMFYTALRRLERMREQVAHRERLAQLGQMVSIVAHEIRNPLGIIEQTSDLIRRKYSRDREDPLLGYISEEVERLNRLVNRFLDFARPSEATAESLKQCDLAKEVRETHALLIPQAEKKDIRFGLDIEENLPPIVGMDREQAKQVLLNLILNAFDATPPGKSVWIVLKRNLDRVLLVVGDEGVGMTPQQMTRATDPFFTTKEKGSGLGLALVLKMVDESRATFEIDSTEGQGTQVAISFKC